MYTEIHLQSPQRSRRNPRHAGVSAIIFIFMFLFCAAKDAAAVAAPAITSTTAASGTVGNTFSYQIAASNTPTAYSASGLPAGVALNATSGLISGTPTASGTYAVALSATNSGGTGNATLTLTITPISYCPQATATMTPTSTSSVSLAFPTNTIAGDVILLGFDYSPSATPSSVTDSQGNTFTEVGTQLTSPGDTLSMVYYAKNIKGGPDTITVNFSGSSYLELYITEYYGMNLTSPIDGQAGASGSSTTVSSGSITTTTAGDVIFGYCMADSACTVGSGFTARSTLDQNLIEDELVGSAGSYAATATATSGWSMQMVALKPIPLTITSATTASGTVGKAFSYQVTASNMASAYSALGLPAGITLNATTGLISGTPTAAGTYAVALSAANAGRSGNANLTLTITPTSYCPQATATMTPASASSVSLAFPNNTIAGDVILLGFDYSPSATPSSVTDSQGNTFTEVGTQLTSPGDTLSMVYYAKNIKGGPDTITVNFSGSSYLELYITEYYGMNLTSPIDGQAGASGSSTTVSSGSITTTTAGDVIFGYCMADSACTVGSGFTARSTLDQNLIEDEVVSSVGKYAATATANGGWSMQMVALKPASAVAQTPVVTSPAASLSATTLAFGNQLVGAASAAQTLTLSNTGTAALSISSIAVTGTNAGDFAQTNTCGSSVAASSKCTVSVTFKPTATGARTAAVTLTDNSSGGQQTVSLSGTGTAPTASLSPSSLTFASQAVGAISAAQAVTISNSGTAALSISSIALTGTNAGDFAETTTCGSSVTAGATCAISVTFKPTGTGTRTAAVTLTDNAAGSPQSVSLSGTGAAASASVTLSPTSLSFGSEAVDMGTSPQTITLTNSGNAALSITSIAITGADTADFPENNTCGSSLAAGANCTISVLFQPVAAGARTASLTITDNASGSTQGASLSGTGLHDVVVSWAPSTSTGVTGYYIYRGTASGAESSTPLNSTPVTTSYYYDGAVTAGTTYYYMVTAVSGTTQSSDSSETSATVP